MAVNRPVSVAPVLDAITAHQIISRIEREIRLVILGKDDVIRAAVTCFVAGGHLLVEDVPGVGKTTLARALAKAVGGSFRRIQFTSDLLPTDILGVGVFDQTAREFCFHPGPIFANVVLADEINRATPKTQSALLEAMSDRQVTAEGQTRPLPEPFLVVATQNPLEIVGTYPLPESQLDRFLMRVVMGYPAPEAELQLMAGHSHEDALRQVAVVCTGADLVSLQRTVASVRVEDSLLSYVHALVQRTRQSGTFAVGASPRGAMSLVQAARARALAEARDYCVPDDVQRSFLPVLAHRLHPPGGMPEDGRAYAEDALRRILASVPVPT
jgi:MoxR-like ATPase